MKNEEIIKEIIKKRGFSRMICRDTWTKGSWSVRFYEYDVEIYDDVDKTGYYFMGNVNSLNIEPIMDEIDALTGK